MEGVPTRSCRCLTLDPPRSSLGVLLPGTVQLLTDNIHLHCGIYCAPHVNSRRSAQVLPTLSYLPLMNHPRAFGLGQLYILFVTVHWLAHQGREAGISASSSAVAHQGRIKPLAQRCSNLLLGVCRQAHRRHGPGVRELSALRRAEVLVLRAARAPRALRAPDGGPAARPLPRVPRVPAPQGAPARQCNSSDHWPWCSESCLTGALLHPPTRQSPV